MYLVFSDEDLSVLQDTVVDVPHGDVLWRHPGKSGRFLSLVIFIVSRNRKYSLNDKLWPNILYLMFVSRFGQILYTITMVSLTIKLHYEIYPCVYFVA